MVVAKIFDGYRTINFNGFDYITPRWNSPKLFKGEKIDGKGQRITDGGTRSEIWVFEFILKSDNNYPDTINTKSAYQKWEEFEFMLNIPSKLYGYQRKLTFEKPDGSGTETLNGKIVKPVSVEFVAGDNEIFVEGKFEFGLDTVSKQVP